MRGLIFFALVCVLGVANAHAQAVASLVGGQFSEVVRREAPVSSRDLVGVAFAPAASPVDLTQVYVRGSGEAGPVCLTIASRDGSYFARNGYTLPATSGAVRLPVTTAHGAIYRRASFENLAFAVHRGACMESARVVLPVTFGPTSVGGELVIAVNGGRGQATVINGTARTPCTRIPEGQRTSFDSLCATSLTASADGRANIQIERCVFGECSRSPSVAIELR